MSSEVIMEVVGASKVYPVYEKSHHRLMQMLSPPRDKARWSKKFPALTDVSFKLKRGEVVGIVGRNGSGKSTLLQMVCGTLAPTAGVVSVSGRIAALLELGAGFNVEFTGRENVYVYGTVLGLSREEVDRKFLDIVDFADIGEFIDQPVKTYSSGMYVRLAFAVATNVVPDILVVDEALAVGDAKFQAKCFARLRSMRDAGTSILFVSHSTEQIVTHCDRAILLEGGRLIMDGAPKDVVNRYLDLLFGRSGEEQAHEVITPLLVDSDSGPVELDIRRSLGVDPFSIRPNYNAHEYRWGDGAARIVDFVLLADERAYPLMIESGSAIMLKLAVSFERKVSRPIVGVTIKSVEGVTVYATNSEMMALQLPAGFGDTGTTSEVEISFRCILAKGDYFVSLGIASRDGEEVIPHDRRYDALHIQVMSKGFAGFVDFGAKVEVKQWMNGE